MCSLWKTKHDSWRNRINSLKFATLEFYLSCWELTVSCYHVVAHKTYIAEQLQKKAHSLFYSTKFNSTNDSSTHWTQFKKQNVFQSNCQNAYKEVKIRWISTFQIVPWHAKIFVFSFWKIIDRRESFALDNVHKIKKFSYIYSW
jgi:hypothetical protein